MALEVKNLKTLPAGKHTGIILNSEVKDMDFRDGKGLQSRLEWIIQPKNPKDGVYPMLTQLFTPEVNPLSNLGKVLAKLGLEPDYSKDTSFEETSINGTEISFVVMYEKDNQFPRIAKDSIGPV